MESMLPLSKKELNLEVECTYFLKKKYSKGFSNRKLSRFFFWDILVPNVS